MKTPNYRLVVLNPRLYEAVKVLKEELGKDEELFDGWQSNIAMAFYDAYWNNTEDRAEENINKIANQAAHNFLNNLINQNEVQ